METRYKNLSDTDSFKKLAAADKADIKKILTGERISGSTIEAGSGLFYNYAAKPADSRILATLQQLADEQQVIEKYRELLSGAVMNTGENRMVLHHLTRGNFDFKISEAADERKMFYGKQAERFMEFADKIHRGEIKSSTGAKFDTAVQIGIGGSDLGPRALYIALRGYMNSEGRSPFLHCEFISNVDPDDASDVLERINPETTIFIVVSKSGTTQETLTNTHLVKSLIKSASPITDITRQMVAVTAEGSPMAGSDDFLESFYIDDFIGGRYSSTSAVGGVILSLAYGGEIFKRVLEGAHSADLLALERSIEKNGALMDALLGIYDRHILGCQAEAILPYSQALLRFPAHLQQLMMESNGKSVNREGNKINYSTCPAVFGEPGTNGQHSFYQQLHQGSDIVPLKFIGFKMSQYLSDQEFGGSSSQKKLNANLAAQITAFALGQKNSNLNRNFCGGRGSDLLFGERLTPETLGSLLAHFENRTMFQGFLWNINSFDQEGVQLGKKLADSALRGENSGNEVLDSYSSILFQAKNLP